MYRCLFCGWKIDWFIVHIGEKLIDWWFILLQGYVFVDRDGKHFRHLLNWLRDGVVPSLEDKEYSELLREAEYYQLLVSHSIFRVQNYPLLLGSLASFLELFGLLVCHLSNWITIRGHVAAASNLLYDARMIIASLYSGASIFWGV